MNYQLPATSAMCGLKIPPLWQTRILSVDKGETSNSPQRDDKNMLGNKRPFVPSVGGMELLCIVQAEDNVFQI